MSSSSLKWEFPNLNGTVYTPFECKTEPNDSFEKLWKDARGLEDEIEILKWMARRKELEWDCAREMVVKKKSRIKEVKARNLVKTNSKSSFVTQQHLTHRIPGLAAS